jgi:uncharacterized membrane protein YgcG
LIVYILAVFFISWVFVPLGLYDTLLWWSNMKHGFSLDMLRKTTREQLNKHDNLTFHMINVTLLVMVLAPAVIFGTAYTSHIYSNHSSFKFIKDMYEFSFSCFTNSDTCFQYSLLLDFNVFGLPSVIHRFSHLFQHGFGSYSTHDFIQSSRDCSLLAFLFSVLKSITAGTQFILSLYSNVSRPIPFYKLAAMKEGEELVIVSEVATLTSYMNQRRKSKRAVGPSLPSSTSFSRGGNSGGGGGGGGGEVVSNKGKKLESGSRPTTLSERSLAPDSTRIGKTIKRRYVALES